MVNLDPGRHGRHVLNKVIMVKAVCAGLGHVTALHLSTTENHVLVLQFKFRIVHVRILIEFRK